MSCIKDDLIQKYIDGEVSQEDAVQIKKHVAGCEKCSARVMQQQELAIAVKRALNKIAEDRSESPVFVVKPHPANKSHIRIKRIIYDMAAACVIFFAIVFWQRKAPEKPSQILIVPGFASDVDANKPVSKQDMKLQVIDENGNVSEYFFE